MAWLHGLSFAVGGLLVCPALVWGVEQTPTLEQIVDLEVEMRGASRSLDAKLEEKDQIQMAAEMKKESRVEETLEQLSPEIPPPETQPKTSPWADTLGFSELISAEAAEGTEEVPLDPYAGVFQEVDEEDQSSSLWGYFKDRTKWAVGYDLTLEDNIFSEDNNKQEDLISVLETQLFFLETLGSLATGVTYEVNAYRYHRINANSIDHDVSAFLDFQPAAPYRLRTNYKLDISNGLLTTTDDIDIFIRSTDFQRTVKHIGEVGFSYQLTNRDTLETSASFSTTDFQAQPDRNRDRRILILSQALEHELRQGLSFSAGYEFEKKRFPANEAKTAKGHVAAFGLIYDLTEEAKLDIGIDIGKIQFRGEQDETIVSFNGGIEYPINLNPRFTALVEYSDKEDVSATEANLVRVRKSSIGFAYEVTPLITFETKATYSKNRTNSTPSVATTFSRRYTIENELAWQLRENTRILLVSQYQRTKSNDSTRRLIGLRFEMEI